MPRTTPPDRLAKLLDAAAAAFIQHGFQRTQMDDIAERLGVSKGTIYRAVDSKEALFAAVVAWSDSPDELPAMGLSTTTDLAAVATSVATELGDAVAGLALATVVAGRTRLRPAEGFGNEVERITIGLCNVMRDRNTAIMVLDRCACEMPELAGVWFGEGRYTLVDLWCDYLTLRSAHLTVTVDPAILARTIVELVTTWSVKMRWDPAPRPYPDDTAAACGAMVRHLLVGATP